jgi:hypothetical protein
MLRTATLLAALLLASATNNCTPLVIPDGQCWNDGNSRIPGNAGNSSSPGWCCDQCLRTAKCTVWVHWQYKNAGTNWKCYLYTKANATTPCNSARFVAGWAHDSVPTPSPPTPAPPAPTPYIPHPKGARDVLMIVSDDMRPELGCYGCSHMHTPHLDSLAKESLSFDAAYVAVAW